MDHVERETASASVSESPFSRTDPSILRIKPLKQLASFEALASACRGGEASDLFEQGERPFAAENGSSRVGSWPNCRVPNFFVQFFFVRKKHPTKTILWNEKLL